MRRIPTLRAWTKVRLALLIAVAATWVARPALAQSSTDAEFTVLFPVNVSEIQPWFADNRATLDRMISLLRRVQADPGLRLTGVEFTGSASPDGYTYLNIPLAERRLLALEHYVRSHVWLPDSVVGRGEFSVGWKQLERLVAASQLPGRDQVLHILRYCPEHIYDAQGVLIDSRKRRLMDLNEGDAWRTLQSLFFAQLRSACMIRVSVARTECPYPYRAPQPLAALCMPDSSLMRIQSDVTLRLAQAAASVPQPARRERHFYMGLRTNLAYDALCIPRLGAEFYLGRRWSLQLDGEYAWWSNDARHRYWRFYGADVKLRKWMGARARRKPLTGHHLGLEMHVFTYDFEWGGKGYMGGEPGHSWLTKRNYAAGLEYGYAMPLGRRLNLDVALTAGYWWGEYYEYEPYQNGYVWQKLRRRQWVGPVNAELSLVVNRKKGGVEP
jgi:hypothetical protein